MLYRPNFCCHCGEKIARSKWLPWTSRRFCEFCQVEQMQHELLPKAFVVIALLIGSAGIISYLGHTVPGESTASKAKARLRQGDVDNRAPERTANQAVVVEQPSPSNTDASTKLQRAAPPKSSTEPVIYCGALTQKGTPCTRRLKTKGRCWQHTGQPLAEND